MIVCFVSNSHKLFRSQERGILLKETWPHDSDVTGRAVSLMGMATFLAQFLVAMCLGSLIDWFGLQVVMVVGVLVMAASTVISYWVRVDSVPTVNLSRCCISPTVHLQAFSQWLVASRAQTSLSKPISVA